MRPYMAKKTEWDMALFTYMQHFVNTNRRTAGGMGVMAAVCGYQMAERICGITPPYRYAVSGL